MSDFHGYQNRSRDVYNFLFLHSKHVNSIGKNNFDALKFGSDSLHDFLSRKQHLTTHIKHQLKSVPKMADFEHTYFRA